MPLGSQARTLLSVQAPGADWDGGLRPTAHVREQLAGSAFGVFWSLKTTSVIGTGQYVVLGLI